MNGRINAGVIQPVTPRSSPLQIHTKPAINLAGQNRVISPLYASIHRHARSCNEVITWKKVKFFSLPSQYAFDSRFRTRQQLSQRRILARKWRFVPPITNSILDIQVINSNVRFYRGSLVEDSLQCSHNTLLFLFLNSFPGKYSNPLLVLLRFTEFSCVCILKKF